MTNTCHCDVNELLAEARKDWHWSHCMRWDATHWWLFCKVHRVYVLIEADTTAPLTPVQP